MIKLVFYNQIPQIDSLHNEAALRPHHLVESPDEIMQVGHMIEHRGRGDHIWLNTKLLKGLASLVCPELPEHSNPLLSGQFAAALARIDTEGAHAPIGEAFQQRSIIAANVDHKIIFLKFELRHHMWRQCLEMPHHRRIYARYIGMVREHKLGRRKLRDLHLPTFL